MSTEDNICYCCSAPRVHGCSGGNSCRECRCLSCGSAKRKHCAPLAQTEQPVSTTDAELLEKTKSIFGDFRSGNGEQFGGEVLQPKRPKNADADEARRIAANVAKLPELVRR